MNPVAELGSEDVVDETVLGDAVQAAERLRGDDRIEVMAIAGHLGARAGDPGLDPLLQFFGSNAHGRKRSGYEANAILNEA